MTWQLSQADSTVLGLVRAGPILLAPLLCPAARGTLNGDWQTASDNTVMVSAAPTPQRAPEPPVS